MSDDDKKLPHDERLATLTSVMEGQEQLVEMLVGYRTRLEAASFSSAVIDQLICQFHSMLLTQALQRQERER